jgi:hypothetical protein
MDGLRPFHKYHLHPKVVCGSNTHDLNNSCPQKHRDIADVIFQTSQDRPGPVENFTVKAMNPYSAKLSWAQPKLPNGMITQYVVRVTALNSNAENWSINFTVPESTQSTHTAVVDNLIGGLKYLFDVQAVTEAGIGDSLLPTKQITVTMPILAPPRPGRVEIMTDSIHSTDITVRFNSAAFSTKHGLLFKVELIVAQVGADGRPNDSILDEEIFGNRTMVVF